MFLLTTKFKKKKNCVRFLNINTTNDKKHLERVSVPFIQLCFRFFLRIPFFALPM